MSFKYMIAGSKVYGYDDVIGMKPKKKNALPADKGIP